MSEPRLPPGRLVVPVAPASSVQHATLETGIGALPLLEGPVRVRRSRRFRWGLLFVPVVAAMVYFGVRAVGRSERALASEGAQSARIVVYEVGKKSLVRLPIEPGTDVVRLVFHAMNLKEPLAPQPHLARFTVIARGSLGERTDQLLVALPGSTDRVAPEDVGISAGDPVAANVDVHGLGSGDLLLQLDDVQMADGIFLRAYRRDELGAGDLLRRGAKVDDRRGEHLARRAGEVDWIDIDDAEQAAILGARWRKVTATATNGSDLPVRALALAPLAPGAVTEIDERTTSVFELRLGEKSAVVAHGKASVRGKAESDPLARIDATVRYEDGNVTTVSGRGEVVINVPEGETVGIEFEASSPTTVAVSATDPARLEAAERTTVYRASVKQPAIVHAAHEPMVLRISARRPLKRDDHATGSTLASMALDARVEAPGGAAQLFRLRADRARSAFDRYDVRRSEEIPSDTAYFFLLVPPDGTATLTPADGALDLAFAELDPLAPARITDSAPPGTPPPPIRHVGMAGWPGFAARRPSNAAAFPAELRHGVRIAPRFVPRLTVTPADGTTFHVVRPRGAGDKTIGGRIFEPITARFEIDVVPGETITLPLRFVSNVATTITARVDDGAPERKTLGICEYITTTRDIAVPAGETETRAALVLGDDLRGGKHTVSFSVPAGVDAWVHAPWKKIPRKPRAVKPPHWVSGDLED
jgi:hypothetical protein